MTVLQEPVQVKTDVQLVVMSSKSSINEPRAAFSVTASAVGPVRGVAPHTLAKGPTARWLQLGTLCWYY